MKKNVRLSPDVRPISYELHLKPDLRAFTFEGTVTIELSLKKPSRAITLHAKDLDIDSGEVRARQMLQGSSKISYDEKAETATITFKQPVPKGKASLTLAFRGTLNDRMHGFYRSSYELNGEKRYIATTQFESTDARRAFPCFDEPTLKAVFDIALTVPSDKTVISNTMPVETSDLGDGYKRVRFAPTPPMSTYLAAFIVGDFESVETTSEDGVLVRVFTTPGKTHQAAFALECAAKTISFFNTYFDIPYPLPVLDLIAIPDFSAGAMENWGAVTYRETALLVDPEQSSTMNKQWVALVIAHELAHQWFGNLVTMEWWTHLWLNEGFASYIEYLATDHLFPSWQMWTQFLNSDMRPALHADALKHTHPIEVDVHHPSEIASVFDAVSYSKGASIIRMLAEYLGEKNFRDGLRYYLKKHRYGNTETEDLWNALQKVSKKPVGKIMAQWTRAAGYPIVRVQERKNKLAIEQSRYFESPLSAKASRDTTIWSVPIRIASPKGVLKDQVLLTKKSIEIPAPQTPWIKLNAGETGFYRTAYSPELQDRLSKAISDGSLLAPDRLGLIRDVFALSDNGAVQTTDALKFATHYASENEYVIWAELASSLGTMHALIAREPIAKDFETYALGLFQPIGETFSWKEAPSDHQRALLRTLIFAALGRYGDKTAISHSRALFDAAKTGDDRIPADLRALVYATIARHGGAREHAALMAMYKKSELHEEKNRVAGALTAFTQETLLAKTLDFALSEHVRPQDSVRFVAGVGANPHGSELAWKFIRTRWKTFIARYAGSRELSYLLESLALSTSLQRAKELEQFIKKHPTPGTERTVAQVLERIRSRSAWLAREKDSLTAFFKQA